MAGKQVYREEYTNPFDDQIQKEKEKYEKEQKLKNGRKDFDLRIKKLEDLMIQAIDNKSPDYIIDIYVSFYDMFLQLRETVNLISGINVVTEVLFETIEFFDESFKYQNELLESSLRTKYGFFQKLKERRRTKKVSRNLSNRMQVMCDKISSLQGMSMTMVSTLKSSTLKMQATMAKQKEKQAKKDAKKNNGTQPVQEGPSAGRDFLAKYLASKGEAPVTNTDSASGSTGATDKYSDL